MKVLINEFFLVEIDFYLIFQEIYVIFNIRFFV